MGSGKDRKGRVEFMAKRTGQQTEPTEAQWRDLYEAANALRKSACWMWMSDADIFGVQDPASGQKFYCSIMGASDMEFGVVAYRGYQGLKTLLQLLHIEDEIHEAAIDEDLPFVQDALSCTFDDREELDKQDLSVIRSLGLKYRGRNEWPLFRDYTPGLALWYLTGQQCVSLTHILGQALAVAMECKNEGTTDILYGPNDEITLRVARKTADGLVWTSRFMQESEESMESLTIELSDQLLVRKLKQLPTQKRKSWELDRFFLPAAIQDRDRPYYPQMLAIVEHDSGLALSTGIEEEQNDAEEMPADELIDILLKLGSKPRRILVKQTRLFILLEKFCEQLDIEIRLTDQLPKISELRRGFLEFSRR